MNRPWKLVVPAACVALGLAGPVPADQFSMGRVGDYLAEKPVNESVSLSLQQATGTYWCTEHTETVFLKLLDSSIETKDPQFLYYIFYL